MQLYAAVSVKCKAFPIKWTKDLPNIGFAGISNDYGKFW